VDSEAPERTPTTCPSQHVKLCVARDERGRIILKKAKQERTINPNTRLHSDEMRETDENGRLARNPKETLETSEGSYLWNWSLEK